MSAGTGLFDRRVKARALAFMFVGGAVVGVLSAVLPHPDGYDLVGIAGCVVAAACVAAFMTWRHEQLPDWTFHVAMAGATGILYAGNAFTNSAAIYAVMFAWPILFAFTFFTLPLALGHLALNGSALALLFTEGAEVSSPLTRWLLLVGTPLVTGLLINSLLRQLAEEHAAGLRRQLALRVSEERTRRIISSAHDAFVKFDADGHILDWNASAERLFGWTANEVLGRPFAEVGIPPDGREAHHERRNRLMSSGRGGGARFDLELVDRLDRRFPAEGSASVLEEDGRLVIAEFFRDISDRHERDRERVARAQAEHTATRILGLQLLSDASLSHLALADMLPELLEPICTALAADAAVILLREEDELVLRASTAGESEAERVQVSLDEGFAARVAAERLPTALRAPRDGEEDLLDPALRGQGLTSLLAAPLIVGGEITGLVQVAAHPPRQFDDEDLGLLRLAADRVALAIDHAQVFEREHRIAETLQRSLLPERLPDVPGIDVAARYIPAADEAEVGGDWYDVMTLPSGRVGLVMGDVAGKGLQAAAMVGQLRSALRAYALEDHAPSVVVSRLNRLVWSEGGQMATLLFCVFDPVSGELRVVNAGHPPPLMLPGGGPPEYLEGARAVPLGVVAFPTYVETLTRVVPGGGLLLYTDGLVERPPTAIDVGLERLANAAAAGPDGAGELCDRLLAELLPPGGATDDVALLALHDAPLTDGFDLELPNRPDALGSLRGLLRRWLAQADGSDEEIYDITTACGEACTNAIEHAHGLDAATYRVTGRLVDGVVELEVRDLGRWRPPQPSDGGRGLTLMEALMDSVEVIPTPEGTTVRLRRRLGASSPAGSTTR